MSNLHQSLGKHEWDFGEVYSSPDVSFEPPSVLITFKWGKSEPKYKNLKAKEHGQICRSKTGSS